MDYNVSLWKLSPPPCCKYFLCAIKFNIWSEVTERQRINCQRAVLLQQLNLCSTYSENITCIVADNNSRHFLSRNFSTPYFYTTEISFFFLILFENTLVKNLSLYRVVYRLSSDFQ